ncbi:Spermidine/putrescine transport system permease protein PotB [compost metagenome]
MLCAVLAYPVALIMAKETSKVIRTVTFLIVISPLLTSVVVRSYGWRILLSSEGPVNSALLAMGFIDEPLNLLTSEAAVVMSILHVLLPFAIITLATSIGAIDNSLYRASASLGGSPIRSFFRVTVPMSLPGLLGGSMIVFSLALGIYVTPLLVGGGNQSLVGLRIYEQVMRMFNQPIGAAFSFVLLACALVVVLVLSALSKRWEKRFNG